MKYTILINQAQVFNADLHTKTDLIDWATLDYINAWQNNSKASRLQDYVWINYKHLIKEMPLLGLNSKSAVSNRITKLRDLNLIESIQDDFGRLFIKTTQLFCNITHNIPYKKHYSASSPSPAVHSAELPVHYNEPPVHHGEHSYKPSKPLIKKNNNTQPQIQPKIDLDLSPVVVVELEKTFSNADLPASKKALASIPAPFHLQVLAVLMLQLTKQSIPNKVGYLCRLVSNVKNGTFTPVPVAAVSISVNERIKQEKINKAKEEERGKINNVSHFVNLVRQFGDMVTVPEQYQQAVFERLACC
jgi:hypothetical protein